ncbi:hypothetical protein GLX30_20975 [Streptomyces sp. Tu 2975]|uniref:FG-GAP-like repeat-containing protein n=1 Tax=Streptomyces sp. Tu 2975 TaxID=2676871 RepID=UPI00135B268C|nr:FG-GAP-like repeat-containing protein [Streptomyces sp. Tu 2975]QIP88649.1 hypothetical protein GLX30_20975 [Streptomyces sp. Tu 2975]
MESGRAATVRSRAARRLVTCTALAASAGMLLAGTASAADGVPPQPKIELSKPDAGSGRQPTAEVPERKAATGEPRYGTQAVAKPRSDVSGDGLSDLIYRVPSGQLVFHPLTGGEPQEFFLDYAQEQDIIPVGDLDADGGAEILSLSPTGTLSLHPTYSGTSLGTTWSGNGWQVYNKVVAVGDLDDNGHADLVARTPDGQLYLYRGTGSLTAPFTARIEIGGGWQGYDQIVGLNDNNGDGLGDLVARTPSGDLYFYGATGDMTRPFKGRIRIGGGWQIYNQLVATDDRDGDGFADLLARTPGGSLYIYWGDGTGNFAQRDAVGTGWEWASLFAGAGSNPNYGKSEIMGIDTRDSLYYYWARNNGALAARQLIGGTGDFAGVKKLTLASNLTPGNIPSLMFTYDGTLYSDGAVVGGGWDAYNMLVGPGDLSGDGKGDLLARDGSGNLYLYRGYGTGDRFAAKQKIGSGWGAFNELVGAGDYTGDGRADLLARTPAGTLYLYKGTGSASSPFRSKVKLGTGWQQFNKLAAPGDIDGDGKADLLAANSRGELFRYSGTGVGTFKPKAKLGTGWNTYRDII